MISVTPEVQAILDSGAAWFADLYTIGLRSGSTLRYTTADTDVVWDGHTWHAHRAQGTPLIERGSITFETGLAVDQLELRIRTDEQMTVNGVTWPHAIRAGLLDGADVTLVRAVGPLGGGVAGIIPRFTGRVGPAQPGRAVSTLTVDSLLAYLRAPVPRNTYQPACANTIYDSACGIDRATREVLVTVTSVSLDGLTVGITGTHAADAWLGGFARYLTGVAGNLGQQVTIKGNGANSLTLLYPFPVALAAGHSLKLAPGCRKTLAACAAYGNTPRFRGHPHVPVPETLL